MHQYIYIYTHMYINRKVKVAALLTSRGGGGLSRT